MVNQKNPFGDYMKMFGEVKSPSMDMNALFSIGRRNAEAMSAATSVMAESMQSATQQQAENVRGHVERVLKTAKEMMVGGSPEINTSKQTELAKMLFESSVKNFRETSEIMTKSLFEASDVLNRRATESMEEMNKVAKAA
jgi:phasin family protein